MPQTDPIYRVSAMALQALPHDVMLSWMAELLTIRTLATTTGGPSCPK